MAGEAPPGSEIARHGSRSGFTLRPPHDELDCDVCHDPSLPSAQRYGFGILTACSVCHDNPHGDQFVGRYTHCTKCHQKHFQVGEFTLAQHKHFSLEGPHRAVACSRCHVKDKKTGVRRFAGTPSNCSGFHRDPHQRQFGWVGKPGCNDCHDPQQLNELKIRFAFDHGKETGYPLVGPHAQAPCARCHTARGPAKNFARRGCGGCHVDPHRGQLGTSCEQCHDKNSLVWRAKQDVAGHDRTRFPLSGTHLTLACEQCHGRTIIGEFRGLNPRCLGCHAKDYNSAPNHVGHGFPQDCERCHTTTVFKDVRPFHTPGSNCIECHAGDFVRGPKHTKPGFPTDCLRCHVGVPPARFAGATMNHSGLTNCYACHDDEFNSAAATNHAAQSYPTDCASCHTTTSFARGGLVHPAFVHLGVTAPSSGPNHRNFSGQFFSCNVCHTTRQTRVVQCTGCHGFPPD